MAVCDCNVQLGNTGLPNCVSIQGVTGTIMLVNYKDDSGVINSIDTTVTMDQAFWDAKVNNTDKSQRLHPVKNFINVEDLRADPTFETLNNGANIFIQNGQRTFNGALINHSTVFLGKIIPARCTNLAAFIIDLDGNVIGNGGTADQLNPIRIDQNTWNPQLIKSTDTTSQKVGLSFEWDRIEKDESIRMIAASETTIDMLEVCGLIDVNSVVFGAPTVTEFVVDTTFDYGTQVTKQPLVGQDAISDWDLNEISPTPGAAAITGVVESPAGRYTISAATTSADVLELDLVKDGFEMDTLTVTIP